MVATMTKQDTTTVRRKAAAAPDVGVPDLSTYLAIHQAMRVSNEKIVDALATLGEFDRSRAAALARWFKGYGLELRHHHHVEDDYFFPALAARVPAYAEYSATLADDHEHLHDLIDRLQGALDRLATAPAGMDAGGRRGEATVLAVELRDLLRDHLDFEDRDVLPLFERHFSAEEYAALDEKAVKSITPRQAFFTLPWFMATVDPETAADALATAPLPFKLLWRVSRVRYARMTATAFGVGS
jgi:hemerythrin-like domain-containing protein